MYFNEKRNVSKNKSSEVICALYPCKQLHPIPLNRQWGWMDE
jgi:hypothetical protein